MFAPVNDAFSEPLLAVSLPFTAAAAFLCLPLQGPIGLLLMPLGFCCLMIPLMLAACFK